MGLGDKIYAKLHGNGTLQMKEVCHEVMLEYAEGRLTITAIHECSDDEDGVIVQIGGKGDDGLRALEKLEAFAQGHMMDEHLNRSGVDF